MQTGSWDPAWESVFRNQEWGKYPPEHVVRWAARHFYPVPDRRQVRILDLGSGPGACTWYLSREGFAVDAIDGSPTAICRLQERLTHEGLSVTAVVGDFTRLPYADASFDGVVDNVSLCCNPLTAMATVVAEVHRVLKPGGTFSSTNFTDRSWGYGLGRPVAPGSFDTIADGPLAGKGYCHFMGRSDVDALYGAFADVQVETLAWTVGAMAHTIELWSVTCRKP